jgi:hypothetical protein
MDEAKTVHDAICEIWSERRAFEPVVSGPALANVEFIANARQDIPDLLDALYTLMRMWNGLVDYKRALERALYGHCGSCIHDEAETCPTAEGGYKDDDCDWRFNEARFEQGTE